MDSTPLYKNFAIDLAQKAGQIIKTNFSIGMEKEWKQDDTPLTVTDTTINKLVIEEIQNTYPGHKVLGEEESVGDDSEYVTSFAHLSFALGESIQIMIGIDSRFRGNDIQVFY